MLSGRFYYIQIISHITAYNVAQAIYIYYTMQLLK